MQTVKNNGRLDILNTIRINLPSKRRTRSLKTIRKDINKTNRIIRM